MQALLSHEGFRRYFLNTGWLFAEKILRLVSALFVGAYMARYLGPSQYGLLNYVLSLVAIPTVIAALGLDIVVIREIVRHPEKERAIMGTAFALKALTVSIVFALLVSGAWVLGKDDSFVLTAVVSLTLLLESLRVLEFYFMAKVMSRYVVISQMIALTAISAARIILIQLEAPLLWFAWTYTLDIAIFFASLVFFYYRNGVRFHLWRFERGMVRTLLDFSWPMIFSSLAITVYMKIDQIMVRLILGDEANGFYGVAVRLSEMWNFIPVAICSSLFPAILNARAVGERLYLDRLRWLYDLMLALAVSISVGMTLFGDLIVSILFGPAYAMASHVIVLYTWSSIFVFLGVAIGRWMLAENLQLFGMIIYTFAAVLNVVLNLVLIPALGLPGAAWSTLISYAFAPYLGLLFNKRTRSMFFYVTQSFNIFTLPGRILKGLKDLQQGI